MIALGTRIKKNLTLQTKVLTLQLRSLENDLVKRPSRRVLRKIVSLRSKLRTLAHGRVEKSLLYTRQKYYVWANKPHTLLAKMLRDETVQRTPYSVRDPQGTIVYDPNVVAEQFHTFFSRLYSLPDTLPSDTNQREAILHKFLSECQLPTLPTEAMNSLGDMITTEEVPDVLKSLPSGKAPGPDGFTYLYYQTFKEQLLPYLTSVYNSFLEGKNVPDSMLHSYISLIRNRIRIPCTALTSEL